MAVVTQNKSVHARRSKSAGEESETRGVVERQNAPVDHRHIELMQTNSASRENLSRSEHTVGEALLKPEQFRMEEAPEKTEVL
jgi:hypothetical protein